MTVKTKLTAQEKANIAVAKAALDRISWDGNRIPELRPHEAAAILSVKAMVDEHWEDEINEHSS